MMIINQYNYRNQISLEIKQFSQFFTNNFHCKIGTGFDTSNPDPDPDPDP